MLCICSALIDTTQQFSRVFVSICASTAVYKNSVAPQPCQHMAFSIHRCCFPFSYSADTQGCCTVVLVSVSLMADEIDHLFICLWTTCISSSLFIYLFIYFSFFKFYLFIFGCVGSLLQCAGISLRWLLLLQGMGSRRAGFSSCGMWAQ